MAIIHPLQPRMPATLVIGVILAIWVTSSMVALPNILYGTTYTRGLDTYCVLYWPDGVRGNADFL